MTTATLRFELTASMDGFRSAVGDAESRWNQATGAMRRAAGEATAGMSTLGERAKGSFTGVSQAANAAATAMRSETAAAGVAAAASIETMADRAAAGFARVPAVAHQAKQKIEQDFSDLYASSSRTFANLADGAERSFAAFYPAVAASTSKASQAVAAAVQVTERTFADLVPALAASTQASGAAVASFSERAKAAFAGLAESTRGAIRATEQSFADLYPPTERARGAFAGLADRARTSFAALGQAAQTGTQAAEAALQRHSGVVGTITASLSRQLSGVVGAYLGFSAVGAVVRGAINATKQIDDLGDIADAAGLTTDKYQELRFAAEQTGAAHEEFDRAILKFSEGLGGVRTHAGDLYEFLKYADQQLLAQLQTTTDGAAAFDVMAAAIRGLADPQDQALLRMKAFGEVGRKVADMIASDYKAAGRQAQEFGVIWSREVIDKASATQREWVTASSVFGHTLKEALLTIMPVATKVLEIVNAIAEKIGAAGTWLSNTPFIRNSADFVPSGIARLAAQGLDDKGSLAAQQSNLLRTQNEIAALEHRLAERKTKPFGSVPEILRDGVVTTMEGNLDKLRKQAEEYQGLIALGGLRGTIVDMPPAVMPPPPPSKKRLGTKPDAGTTGTDVFTELKADLTATIALHEKMAETVGASEGAMARWRANLEITNADQKAGNKLTAEQKAELHGLTEQLEAATDAAEQARSRFETFMEVGASVASTLEDAFGRMISGTKVNFKELVAGMLQDLAKLAFRANIIEPLFGGRSGNGVWGSLFGSFDGALGGGSGAAPKSFRAAQEATGGGGFLGSIASGIGSFFGGFRERGGPVAPGKAYVVGEKRPELFVPDVPGTIVPRVPSTPLWPQAGGTRSAPMWAPVRMVAGLPTRSERISFQPATVLPRLAGAAVRPLAAPDVERRGAPASRGLVPILPAVRLPTLRFAMPSRAREPEARPSLKAEAPPALAARPNLTVDLNPRLAIALPPITATILPLHVPTIGALSAAVNRAPARVALPAELPVRSVLRDAVTTVIMAVPAASPAVLRPAARPAPALTAPRPLALVSPVASVPRLIPPVQAPGPSVPALPAMRSAGRGGYFTNAILRGMGAVQSFAAAPERASQINAAIGAAKTAVGNLGGSRFGGFREAGGDVDPGQSYVVGEKQPELFVPRVAGSIVPRVAPPPRGVVPAVASSQAALSAAATTVTNVYNIDARGADISVAKRIEAAIAAAQRAQRDQAAAVAQQQRRHPYRAP